MRKKVIFYSLIIILSSFFLMFPLFNNIVIRSVAGYIDYYTYKGYEHKLMQIELTDSINNVSYDEFNGDLNDLAIKNNLVIYRVSFSQDENSLGSAIKLYLSTNDLFIRDRLFLQGGYADSIDKEIVYTNTSKNLKEKIFIFPSFVDNSIIEVTSIENNAQKNATYVLISLSDDIDTNISNFINDLDNKYFNFSYGLDQSLLGTDSYKDNLEYAGELFNRPTIKFSICAILSFLLFSNILSNRKKISILKLEGNSSLSLYNDIFLKTYIFSSLFFTVLVYLIIFIFFHRNTNTLYLLIELFSIETIQMFAIYFVMSLIGIIIISNIELVKSINGYLNLKYIFDIAYVGKCIILILLLPIIISSFTNINNLMIIASRKDKVNSKLENYYTFTYQKKSNYEVGSNDAVNIYKDFVNDSSLFSFSTGELTPLYLTDDYAPIYVYFFDDNYIREVGLESDENKLSDINIYLKKNVDYDLDNLILMINALYNNAYNINVCYYDFDINTFDTDELLYSDNIDFKPIIYVPIDLKYDSQLNFKIFKYNGDLIKAQAYADNVFLKNNCSPLFNVESLKASYNAYYATVFNTLMLEILKFLLLIIAYCYTNAFIIEIDFISNYRKYYLSFSEGVFEYDVFSYLLKFSTPAIYAFIICLLLHTSSFKHMIMNFFIIFIIELLFYIRFVFNKRKYGNIHD